MNKIDQISLSNLAPRGLIDDLPKDSGHRFPYLMGIELELENVPDPYGYSLPGWEKHEDPSLRNGIEYVTASPIGGLRLDAAVAAFYKAGVSSDNSPRTSTHIHVNASDLNVGQLRTMFVLTHILENALFQVISETRKYCGYCMPLSEMSPQRMRDILVADNWNSFVATFGGRNEDKYYGFNINSIRKHGTVEFRYFYGGPTKDELLNWLQYCTYLKTMARAVAVDDLFALPDEESLVMLLAQFLGPWAETLINVQGPSAIFDTLQELAALYPDQDKLVRDEELVFVSDALLNVVQKSLFLDGGPYWHKFASDAKELKVMTSTAWSRMLMLARQGRNIGEVAPKKAAPGLNQLAGIRLPYDFRDNNRNPQ